MGINTTQPQGYPRLCHVTIQYAMSVLRGFFPREEESSNAQYAHGVQDLFRKGIKIKMQQQKVSSVFLAQLTVYLLDTGVNDTLIDKIYGVMLALSRVLHN